MGLFCMAGPVLVHAYLHFSASMSFPGVSRHLRMSTLCWRTMVKASSSSRAWSSTGGGGDAMMVVELGMIARTFTETTGLPWRCHELQAYRWWAVHESRW